MENLNVLNQVNKYQTLTNKYKVVTTNDLINKFINRGFKVDKVIENKVRKVEKQGYQKHRIILNHPELLNIDEKNGYAQLLVTNSYDGSSGIVFQLGYFRLVCSNGLVVGNTFQTISIRHSGIDLDKKLDSAIVEISAQAKQLGLLVAKMQSKQLSLEQIKDFELKVANIRLPLKTDLKLIDVSTPVLRLSDKENDLFTVFNRIQESHIRGGAQLKLVDVQGNIKNTRVRALKGIDSSTKLNRTLFDIAENLLAA